MGKRFKYYDLNQRMLLPPDLREWLSEDHLAYFVSDLVESMDLKPFYKRYNTSSRGQPPYHPRMLLKLLIYGYCIGVRSSRKIEKATYEDVAFRVLAADQHPDHDTISNFRQQHLENLKHLFDEVLVMCQKSGLVKVGKLNVSIDGTKLKASSSKKRSYRYKDLVDKILDEAELIDQEEDKIYGKGKRGDELPEHLSNRKKRLETLKQLREEMEAELKEVQKREEILKEEKKKEDKAWYEETGQKLTRVPDQRNRRVSSKTMGKRNLTDYDSRLMKINSSGGYMQSYNCQAAVDYENQIIVAADVTSSVNDRDSFKPLLDQTYKNLGEYPQFCTADKGYYSERNILAAEHRNIDLYLPPLSNAKGLRKINSSQSKKVTLTKYMKEKLSTKTGKSIYKTRAISVEPVFGQIKGARGIQSFYLRGLKKVKGEWNLIAATHNILKIYRKAPVAP